MMTSMSAVRALRLLRRLNAASDDVIALVSNYVTLKSGVREWRWDVLRLPCPLYTRAVIAFDVEPEAAVRKAAKNLGVDLTEL